MDQSIYLRILSDDPVLAIKMGLRFLHFIGLAIGLGSATLLDVMLIRFFVLKKISRESWEIVHFAALVINFGLLLLWITGIGFVGHYALFEPEKLMNPKIWAKLSVVAVLTLNGLFIHAVILPRIRGQIQKALFDGMNRWQRSTFLVSGAVSATSWYVPVILGAFSQLNFVIPMGTILISYAILLVAAIVMMHAMMAVLAPAEEQEFDRIAPSWP